MFKKRSARRRSYAAPLSLVIGLLFAMPPFASPTHAQELGAKSKTAVSPKPGSVERKRVVDALRAVVSKKLKQPVIFEISHIRTEQGWAFLTATPRQPNRKPVNYLKTTYAEQVRASMFDDGICALLRRENGTWKVKTYNIGATDVQWLDWGGKYGAPSAIFPFPERSAD